MKEGEIWLISLDPTIGSEIKKARPCLILNSNLIGKLPLKVIAPITDFKAHYCNVPWMVTIEPSKNNMLSKKSTVDLFQIRSVSQKRFVKKIGSVDRDILLKCKDALDIVLDINLSFPQERELS